MTEAILRPFATDDADWLVAQHATLYARDEGFDARFGVLVADIVCDFLADHDPDCERGWIAGYEGERLGSIFCVRLDDQTAKLRLFLLVPKARGQGLGQHLLEVCMGFARDAGYRRLTLWTHESHKAACALYARNGFACLSATPVASFGQDNVEQQWAIDL